VNDAHLIIGVKAHNNDSNDSRAHLTTEKRKYLLHYLNAWLIGRSVG